MDLRKSKDRSRFRLRLSEGTQQAKREEALRGLAAIQAALESVRSDTAASKARFRSLADTESDDPAQAVSPVLVSKASTYKHWAPILLVVEGAIAMYCASLTLIGGFLIHVIAGVALTLLFTGIAKVNVTGQVDIQRWHTSVERLEHKLRSATTVASVLLLLFFFTRFLPFAELLFAIVSSLLSFVVAYLAAICMVLSDLMSASDREIKRYQELTLLEAELSDLLAMAERLASDGGQRQTTRATPLAITGLVLLLGVLPIPLQAASLNIWIDTSGSLKADEFERLRTLLAEPLPLLERLEVTEIAIAPFWSEDHALLGTTARWQLPAPSPTPTCEGIETRFTATRRARVEACEKAKQEAAAKRQQVVDAALAGYTDALAIDVTVDQAQTCLHPILKRFTASGAGHFHVLITDGAHANCGPEPAQPVDCACAAVVLLVPDSGGNGVAARMESRTARLQRLYPGLVVLPSWQVMALDRLFTALTDRLP